MSNLAELRREWEEGSDVVLAVVKDDHGFKTLHVVLKLALSRSITYRLNRYFKLSSEWVVSVDVDSKRVRDVFAKLKDDFSESVETIEA